MLPLCHALRPDQCLLGDLPLLYHLCDRIKREGPLLFAVNGNEILRQLVWDRWRGGTVVGVPTHTLSHLLSHGHSCSHTDHIAHASTGSTAHGITGLVFEVGIEVSGDLPAGTFVDGFFDCSVM